MTKPPLDALILALPETAGSALYGMVDVLSAAGNLWQTLVGAEPDPPPIRVRIASPTLGTFRCGNGIPVMPDIAIADDPSADIVILPELWLGPDEPLHGRYPEIADWVRQRYRDGASIYTACSGAILLAETGLLDGREATSHWGYSDLFRRHYPKIKFRPEPNLVFADPAGRLVTAGGTTSWHDLAIHIIARHVSPGEAMRIAKIYLLKWHDEGQLPYTPLVRHTHHADAAARKMQASLENDFRDPQAVARAVTASGLAERTAKRRFKAATGLTPIDYAQNVRIEEAKRRLETSDANADDIGAEIGYENAAFFRRLFRRRTGLTPAEYRRMFRTLPHA